MGQTKIARNPSGTVAHDFGERVRGVDDRIETVVPDPAAIVGFTAPATDPKRPAETFGARALAGNRNASGQEQKFHVRDPPHGIFLMPCFGGPRPERVTPHGQQNGPRGGRVRALPDGSKSRTASALSRAGEGSNGRS